MTETQATSGAAGASTASADDRPGETPADAPVGSDATARSDATAGTAESSSSESTASGRTAAESPTESLGKATSGASGGGAATGGATGASGGATAAPPPPAGGPAIKSSEAGAETPVSSAGPSQTCAPRAGDRQFRGRTERNPGRGRRRTGVVFVRTAGVQRQRRGHELTAGRPRRPGRPHRRPRRHRRHHHPRRHPGSG